MMGVCGGGGVVNLSSYCFIWLPITVVCTMYTK